MKAAAAVANGDRYEGRWDIGDRRRIVYGLVLIGAQALINALGFAGISRLAGLDMDNAFLGSPAALVTVVATGCLQLVGVVGLGLLAWGRMTTRSLGWRLEGARDVVLGLCGALGLATCTVIVILLSGGNAHELLQEILGFTFAQRIEMLFIGLFAATTEEPLFRGYLQPALMAKLGNAPGLIVGAAIFSLYHAPFMPHLAALLNKFAFGLILGLLRGRDRPLVAPAVAHFGLWQIMGFA